MGEMIGNIAHQWRQPLNTAALLVQEMQLDYEDGKLDDAAVRAFSSQLLGVIDRMSVTIDDFRDFFQPNRAVVDFSVEEAVLTSLSFVEPAFRSLGIRLEVQKTNSGRLRGHPNEFSQVLLNILNNAKDALAGKDMEDKAVVVGLATVDGRQQITITDSGGGIPDEVLPKIFDPYFTTKGPGAGTGIGLFMSKTIVERNMGGQLLVRNARLGRARGAEFTLDLPSADPS